jgi:nicotinamidase-related amidase
MAQSFRQMLGISPSTATPSDSSLIIIDAQNEYADGHLKTADVNSTRAAIAGLVNTYRDAGKGDYIVHVVHDTSKEAPVFTIGTPLAQEFAEVAAKPGEKVVHKVHPGSFADTDLDEHLQKSGQKKVVLCGYMAHVCVSTTARQAAQRGYDVLLAEDAIGDRDVPGAKADDVVKMVMVELGDAFGTVVKSKDIKA